MYYLVVMEFRDRAWSGSNTGVRPSPQAINFVGWISDIISQRDEDFSAIIFEMVWVIWKMRNLWVFSNKEQNIHATK